MTVHGVRPPIRQGVTSVHRERAFGVELCRRHAEALALVASVILANNDAADEVVSDTIAAACRFVDRPDPREVTHAQLARSVYHRCVGRLASRERFLWAWPERDADDCPSFGMSALTTLPISHRAAVALVLFGDHDLAQTATTLSLPLTVVTGHLRDALVKIHAQL
ncbi:RNA polymerase sigma factor [Virgisporangium aurantiacum]|uniref:RNA polymerase sigma-70 factor, ECF subfamily n=1 Tax=Virgisporangium aurantiacum TaxID=175570 RepID=A0A8J4E6C7_9ACTN|nr:hypothetical protein [Virgisporangium aurantiacum]GIJ63940.1 hypothetical protein Vau01_114560 [Virgisporangium aurantiacum]